MIDNLKQRKKRRFSHRELPKSTFHKKTTTSIAKAQQEHQSTLNELNKI